MGHAPEGEVADEQVGHGLQLGVLVEDDEDEEVGGDDPDDEHAERERLEEVEHRLDLSVTVRAHGY